MSKQNLTNTMWQRLLGLGGGLIGLMASVNALARWQQRPLAPRLPGEQQNYWWRGHRIAYTVRGTGTPLLLLHSVNGAASSYEMRNQWAGLAQGRRLYAFDLLGFGGSDRPDVEYSAALYTDLLLDFVREVIGAPTGVLASSLSSTFAVAAADREPHWLSKLLLVAPTGLVSLATPQQGAGRTVQRIVRSPFVGNFLFNLLVSKPSVQFFLGDQTYYDPAFATPEVIEQSYRTGHQPGARFAPAAFLSGALNSNVHDQMGRLGQPVLIAWGRHTKTTPVQQAQAWLDAQPAAKLVIFEQSGGLPHDEEATAFNAVANEFFDAGS